MDDFRDWMDNVLLEQHGWISEWNDAAFEGLRNEFLVPWLENATDDAQASLVNFSAAEMALAVTDPAEFGRLCANELWADCKAAYKQRLAQYNVRVAA